MNLFPIAVDAVRDAIKWLITNANQYDSNAEQIDGLSYLAGANLRLLTGLVVTIGAWDQMNSVDEIVILAKDS